MPTIWELIDQHQAELDAAEQPALDAMLGTYDQVLDTIEDDLLALLEEIDAAGEDVSPDLLYRANRLGGILDAAEAEYDRWAAEVGIQVEQTQRRGATLGSAHARELVDTMSPHPMFAGTVNPYAFERVTGAMRPGSPLAASLNRYGIEGRDIIERGLIDGMARGTGPREITRAIMRELHAPQYRSRIAATVRTETMRAYRGSSLDEYRGMDDIVIGWRWVSGRDLSVCLGCAAMDGTVHALDEEMASHPQCRCSPVPALRPEDTYAVVQAELDARGSGEDWFNSLTPEQRASMIRNRDAAAAFERGNLELSDFLGTVHHPAWGTTITQLSGRQALQARR